jgi:hypothetical protein
VAVLALGLLHGSFWAVVLPPWSLADEPQHLDYILSVKDGVGLRHVPSIWQPLRADVREAVWQSKRWETYRQPPPQSRDDWIAGGTTSYEGYQPPVYYVAMVPVVYLAGSDPLRAMYAVRFAGAVLVGVMAALTGLLAVEWFGAARRSVPLLAGLIVATSPVVAATARVTNDGLIAVLVGLGVYLAARLYRSPTLRASLWLGLTVAAAILTKSPGRLLMPVAVVVLLGLRRRGELSRRMVAAALGPGVMAWLLWATLIYLRYDVPDETSVFVLHIGRIFPTLSPGEFAAGLWERSWFSSGIDAPGFRGLRLAGTTLFTAMVACGLLAFCRPPRPTMAICLTLVVALGIVVVARMANVAGLLPPIGRVLPPAHLPISALTAGGLVRVLGRRGAFVPVLLLGGVALLLEIVWVWPWYQGSLAPG